MLCRLKANLRISLKHIKIKQVKKKLERASNDINHIGFHNKFFLLSPDSIMWDEKNMITTFTHISKKKHFYLNLISILFLSRTNSVGEYLT